MMKKNYRIIGLLMAFILVFSACSNKGGDEKKPEVSADMKADVKDEVKDEKKDDLKEESSKKTDEDRTSMDKIVLKALKGPTAMGLAKFVEDYVKVEGSKFDYEIAGNAQEIVAGLAKGQIQMAAIPANLAATIYNKTGGKIQVAAINTLGVLYIVDNFDGIDKVSDLKGRTIYVPAKGQTPEFVLRDVLTKNGLEFGKDYKFEYKNDPAELAALFKQEKDMVAILPEPFVSVAKMNNKNLNRAIDLDDEWEDVNGSHIVTGVLVVNKDFAEKNRLEFLDFLKKYEDSIDFAEDHKEEASKLIEDQGITKAQIALKSLDKMELDYLDGEKMKKNLSKYLKVLFDLEPKSVGGQLPADDFYFEK